MLSDQNSKKLQKVLNPKKFRFVVILYDTQLDIKSIEEFAKEKYPDSIHKTLDLEKNYQNFAADLYVDNSFIYIDSFSKLLEQKEHYLAFNQRRDKIASYGVNIVVFYPKKLQKKLYKDAVEFIPDLWEFRSAVIELNSSGEEIVDIGIKEDHTYYEYIGMNVKEKIEEVERLEKKLSSTKDKELRSLILNHVVVLYINLAQYEKALQFCKESIDINREIFGEKSHNIFSDYNNLAEIYKSRGEYKKSLQFYKKSLNIVEGIFGDKDPNTAIAYNNLADLYRTMGEYKKALNLYKKSLKIREEVLGNKHEGTAIGYNNLAQLYSSMGKYKKALRYSRKSLKIKEEILDKNSPSVATSYNNMALIYYAMNDFEKVLPLINKSLKIREEALGDKHPQTAGSYYNLARYYLDIGNFQDAYIFIKKAVQIWQEILPASHPDLITSQEFLKFIQQKLNN